MKTLIEYVLEIKHDPEHWADQDFYEDEIIELIKKVQREAYNQAINDAVENATAEEVELITHPYPIFPGIYEKRKGIAVNKTSILILKK